MYISLNRMNWHEWTKSLYYFGRTFAFRNIRNEESVCDFKFCPIKSCDNTPQTDKLHAVTLQCIYMQSKQNLNKLTEKAIWHVLCALYDLLLKVLNSYLLLQTDSILIVLSRSCHYQSCQPILKRWESSQENLLRTFIWSMVSIGMVFIRNSFENEPSSFSRVHCWSRVPTHTVACHRKCNTDNHKSMHVAPYSKCAYIDPIIQNIPKKA